jgi:hypothetical protein
VDIYTPRDQVQARSRILPWLIAVACLPAVLQLLELGRILLSRFAYPYDVHWMDGGTLLHAQRLLAGLPIYPELTREAGFLPNAYPPVLYFVLAGLGAIFGLDYAIGRLVSIVATAVGALLLARQVELRFRGLPLPWAPALLALGAIAAGFPFTGGWYDATMTDPLALMLAIVSGRLLLTDSRALGTARLALVSALMVLTLYTKQSYAALVAWQVLFWCRSNLRQGLLLGALTAGVAGGLLLIAEYLTRGSFSYYLAHQLLRHQSDLGRVWHGVKLVFEFAPYLPVALCLSLVLAFRRALSSATSLWTGMLVFAFPMALVHFAKSSGWANNFMPIVVLGPAASLCVVGDLCRVIKPRQQALVLALCALGAAVLLLSRRYPIGPYIASKQRRVAAARLNAFVANLGADVLIPARPFLAVRQNSKLEQIHIMAWYDAIDSGRKDLRFDDFVRRTRPRYVILADQEPAVIVEAFARDYFAIGRVPPETWPAQTLEATVLNSDPQVPAYPGQLQWVLERSFADAVGSRCLFEFESKSYDGWAVRGEAFGTGPTLIDSQRGTLTFANEGTVVGVVGDAYASSRSGASGSRAVGSLESPVFTIDREDLELRIAGAASPLTRVELRIDGALVHQATGAGNNFMQKVRFGLSGHRGRKGQVVVVDDTSAWSTLHPARLALARRLRRSCAPRPAATLARLPRTFHAAGATPERRSPRPGWRPARIRTPC